MPKRQNDSVYMEPYYSITLGGKIVPPSMLQYVTEVVIDDEMDKHTIGRITIVDRDRVWTNDKRVKKGTPVSIRMGHVKNNRVMLAGKIQNLEADYPEDGYPSMTVVCVNATYSMSEGKRTRTWKNKKVSDVINEILSSYGVNAKIADTGKVIPHIVQNKETDFDFIKRKAKESGKTLPAGATAVKTTKSSGAVDHLYYRKTVHSQIISFAPALYEEEESLDKKSKTEKSESKSDADVNIKDGSVTPSKSTNTNSSANSGTADEDYAIVDKSLGKVTIKSK